MRNLLTSLLVLILALSHGGIGLGHASVLEGTWYVSPQTLTLDKEFRRQFAYLNSRTVHVVGKKPYKMRTYKPLKGRQVRWLLIDFGFVPLEPLTSITRTPDGYTITYGCSIRHISDEDVSPVQSTADPTTDLILVERLENGFAVETIRADGRTAIESFQVVGTKLYHRIIAEARAYRHPLVLSREYSREQDIEVNFVK